VGVARTLGYKHRQRKAVEKRRGMGEKQATTVMEFIPSAQNIAQVLNSRPAEEGQVLSPAYALGLLYRGQAKETMLETGREHCGYMCSKEKWLSR